MWHSRIQAWRWRTIWLTWLFAALTMVLLGTYSDTLADHIADKRFVESLRAQATSMAANEGIDLTDLPPGALDKALDESLVKLVATDEGRELKATFIRRAERQVNESFLLLSLAVAAGTTAVTLVWLWGRLGSVRTRIRTWHGGKIALFWAFGLVLFLLSKELHLWLGLSLLWIAGTFALSWLWLSEREKS